MRRSYKTDKSDYTYYVNETKDMTGKDYFALTVPCPRYKPRRSCGKWANSRLINECIQDFGLTEDWREYRDNGETVIFGY